MPRTVKIIKSATVAFGPVPAGGVVDPALLTTDYGCQVTEARVTATPNTSDVPATFCEPASQVNVPSSFALELQGLQDWGVVDGLSEYLYIHDAEQQAFVVYLDGADDPAAYGVCSIAAGDFGGTAGEPLVMQLTLPCLGKPSITGADGVELSSATVFTADGRSAEGNEADELESV